MKIKQTYQLNDRTLKYQSYALIRREHEYLNLPGNYKTSLPHEVIFPNMDAGRVDELYYTDDKHLIYHEEESDYIRPETLEKFEKYLTFGSYWYRDGEPYFVVVCHKDPGKKTETITKGKSVKITIYYIYFSDEELLKKSENIINKVRQKESLTDEEALDIAFISKYISKEYAPKIVESLAEIYSDAIIEDSRLKADVGVILSAMIVKHIKYENKQQKLLERINMQHIKSEIEKIVESEYGEEIAAINKEYEAKLKEKDNELKEKDNELKEKEEQLKNMEKNYEIIQNIKQTAKNDELNSKTMQLINSLTIL